MDVLHVFGKKIDGFRFIPDLLTSEKRTYSCASAIAVFRPYLVPVCRNTLQAKNFSI